MNERVAKIRDYSLSAIPTISIERAQIVTAVYQALSGKVSIPMLRAHTFRALLENKTIYIGNDELIVGERGPNPKAVPTYPELCCHTLDDFSLISNREKIFFKVNENVMKIQEEQIIPYWQDRSMRDLIISHMTPEWKDCYDNGIFTEFMEQRAPGHTVAGSNIYQKGFLGFKADIELQIKKTDHINDINSFDKLEELKAMLVCCDAIILHAKRYADMALAESKSSECSVKRKKELLAIHEVCTQVPANAPRNFWEALQMYWFVHIGVITELNTWDSFCPGRLDLHLNPFFKAGISNGTLTFDFAKELLSLFWIKFNNQPAPPKVGVTMQESGTYTDFCNINLGGTDADGKDCVNEVSYLLLDVIEEMRLLQPSSNIQLSRKNPEIFLKRALQVVAKGFGQPSIFNADTVFEEMLVMGKSVNDARCGGTSGCVETGAFGKEAYILTGYLNLVKILEITLNNGIDPMTGQKLGVESGNPLNFTSYSQLIDAYKKQLHHFVEIKVTGNNIIEKLYSKYMPAPFMSILIDDCISNAKDYNSGGARYNTNYIQGVGIGSLSDCFSSMKMHIFEHNTMSMQDLLSALAQNFEGFDRLRKILLNKTVCYGNDDEYVDKIMRELFEIFHNEVDGRKTVRGGSYHINMLPTTCHIYFGSVTGATPDGRMANSPQSEGISPSQGVDVCGPTAVIKSASKLDHIKTGGTLLNLKFSADFVNSEADLCKLAGLVRAYFKMDGHHVQFNIVNKETLLNAQKYPQEHRDLIVRVAGYSDYFVDLSKSLQDEIISRTEHSTKS